jgi:hypothetical protein
VLHHCVELSRKFINFIFMVLCIVRYRLYINQQDVSKTIFIVIGAVHVSGFTSPSSGAQETCIRFVRVVAITVLLRGEKGVCG